jgi:hypothetical protein
LGAHATERKVSDDISTPAGNGLAPGDRADPRDGPFSAQELAEASDALFDKHRWLVKQDKRKVDVLALRLQVGRGRTYKSVCEQFDILESSLLKRRIRDRDADERRHDWPTSLSELDRRHMARRIHLAGLARRGVGRVDEAGLKAASDWRVAPLRKTKPIWTSLGDDGPGVPSETSQDNFHDNAEDDPYFHERQRVREQLEALLRQMERDAASRDDAAAGTPVAPGEATHGADGDAGGEPA